MAICHRLNLVLDLLTFTNQLPDRKIFCGDISISEADTDVFFNGTAESHMHLRNHFFKMSLNQVLIYTVRYFMC